MYILYLINCVMLLGVVVKLTEPQHHVPTKKAGIIKQWNPPTVLDANSAKQRRFLCSKNKWSLPEICTYVCLLVLTCMHPSVDASMCPCKRVCVQREQEKLKLSFSSEPPLMWKVNGHRVWYQMCCSGDKENLCMHGQTVLRWKEGRGCIFNC